MRIEITENDIKNFNLTEKDCKELIRLTSGPNGLSKGSALVKMGKATMKVVDCNKEKPTKKATTSTREKKIDPVKNWVLNFIAIPLKGCVETPYKVTNLVNDGSKSIDFEIDGESYTLTLTKHKKKA